MTDRMEQPSRGTAHRVASFAVFALLSLCLPGAASAQWATSGDNINNTNTGNVGVGTSAPNSKLHSAGTVTVGPVDGDIYRIFGLTNPNARWAITNSAAGVFGIAQRGDEWVDQGTRFLIDRSGNIGVGTSAPASKLDVADSAYNGSAARFVQSNASASNGVLIQTQTASANDLALTVTSNAGATVGLAVRNSGNVGVGTAAPAAKLHVAGDIRVDGNINAKYQDVAEWVPTTQKLSAGTVVILDTGRDNHVLASNTSYDTRVAGVVSARPGISLGEAGEGKALVATTGRVKVRVDATRAPIKIGDLIVTSDVEGVAMKSEPMQLGGVPIHRPGTIIGKALEPLADGKGEILVLLNLQ